MTRRETYLDWNATAPLRPEAVAAIAAALRRCGNPSSVHRWGRAARQSVEHAREAVAALIGAAPEGVVFVSGGTEANHLALLGTGRERILVSAVEHSSVLQAVPTAERIAVDGNGIVDLARLAEQLAADPFPAIVSVMLANNETGIIQPIADIAEIAHARGALVHCDAVQAAGKMPLAAGVVGADFVSLSAHKLGGPPGIGALVVAGTAEPTPMIRGGGQEHGRRAGSENLPGIAGFAAAAAAAAAGIADYQRVRQTARRTRSGGDGGCPGRRGDRRRDAAPAQHDFPIITRGGGGNPGDRARSRRRDGQRRRGVLLGQGRPEPCAGSDGRCARDRRRYDPREPRLDDDRGRYRAFPRCLDGAAPAAVAQGGMTKRSVAARRSEDDGRRRDPHIGLPYTRLTGQSITAISETGRMGTMALKQALIVTDAAAERIQALLAGRGKPSLGVRVGVRARGCSGLSYTLEYADEQGKFDEIVEDKGVTILVDPKAVMFIIGTEMDYVEEQLQSGFVFRNPNEKGRCGCGEIFHV